MTTKTAPSTTDRMVDALKRARAIADKAFQDNDRNLSAEEQTEIAGLMAKAAELRPISDLEKALRDLGGGVELVDPADPEDGGFIPDVARKGLGKAFTDNPEYQGWLKGISGHDGRVPEKAALRSPAFSFGGLKAFGYAEGTGTPRTLKALITGTSDTSAGSLIAPDFRGLVDEGAFRPLSVLDVITRLTTDSDVVEYVRVTTQTNAAAPVVEASISGPVPDPDAANTAGVKPESTLALAKITTPVITIAHWLPATRRALSDAAQVRGLIDNFLRYGLLEELEDQIIAGSGVGENFEGILNTTGTQAQPFDADLLTTYRKAKTKVRVVGRSAANAYMMHPNDAERLDLLKDLEGRFYFGGPADDGIQRLWRLPVVETEAITEGTALVGDFRRAVLWDRQAATISVSDSHADFFIRNIIAILAELRAAFGITRPAAFVEIDLTA